MGTAQKWHPIRHLIIFLLFLSIHAQGRAIPRMAQVGNNKMVVAENKVVIGSRPPRCDDIDRTISCNSCHHCHPVQVPIIFQNQNHRSTISHSTIAYSRGDAISNYKPMSWKCQCGNFFFNP